MARNGFARYVALGDSQTEGLWDGDDSTGVAGFADRLAALLDRHYPGLAYANLAVRGRRVVDVLNDQLPQALSMRADLMTVCIGMNDVTRTRRSFEAAMTDLGTLYERLSQSGATVVTTTFPDMARIVPVGWLVSTRIRHVNNVIRSSAARYGFGLVDLYNAPSMLEPQTWSVDRLHASPLGHELFAAAAAEALGLPGSSHDWARPSAQAEDTQLQSHLRWMREMLLPWAWLHVRGQSSGDGRDPKRPVLQPVRACLSQ